MLPTTPCLSSLPRVFLSPVVPGWVDDSGMVRLPLHLNTLEESIGVVHTDHNGLRAWHREHARRFASTFPELGIYRTQREFRAEYRPAWLSETADHVRGTVADFAARVPGGSRLSRLARSLEARSDAIAHVISSCLYLGPAFPDLYCVMPQDLGLFGNALDPKRDLHALAMFLQAAAHVDGLIACGMTDVVTVVHGASGRTLQDAVEGVATDPELRPLCVYQADEGGHIHPLQSAQAEVHGDFDRFQSVLIRENNALVGAFLFASLGWDEKYLRCLSAAPSPAVVGELWKGRFEVTQTAAYDLFTFLTAAAEATLGAPAD